MLGLNSEGFIRHLIIDMTLVPKDALMYSIYATLGLPIISKIEAATNQAILNIIPNEEKINIEFFYYYLLSLKNQIHRFSSQTTQSNLNAKIVKDFDLHIPSDIEEQARIAAILSKADQAISQTEQLIAKYQRIKTGLMQDLLTKGIDDQGNIRSEKTHRFKESNLGKIPKAWEEGKLSDINSFITSGSRNWATYYSSEGALFIRITNLIRENINFKFDDVKRVNLKNNKEGIRTRLQEGDLLISITADLGIIGIIPSNFEEAYINQHIALFRIFEREKYNPRFMGHYLSSSFGQEQFTKLNDGGAKAGLNLPTILKIKFPIMDIKEQNTIALTLDKSDEIIKDYKTQLSKLHSLKSGLMQDLLTGRVRVKVGEVTD